MSELPVVLADRSRLFREGLAHLLQHSGFSVIGCERSVADARRTVSPDAHPELLIFGVGPQTNAGFALADFTMFRANFGGMHAIMLADEPDPELARMAAAAGVDALLSKDISGEVLVRSVDLVMLGQQLFPALAFSAVPAADPLGVPTSPVAVAPVLASSSDSSSPVTRLEGRANSLSGREDQILSWVVAGSPNKLIAHELGISEATVKVHVRALLRKLGATNRTQAATAALRRSPNLDARPTLGSRLGHEDEILPPDGQG